MSSTPLLKTCQTCFKAKIRCEKTQASGRCDRCLRLGKTCVFALSKRRATPRTPYDIDQLVSGLASVAANQVSRKSEAADLNHQGGSATPGSDYPSSPGIGLGVGTSSSSSHSALYPSVNPFEVGILSYSDAAERLVEYRTQLTPHFPFVVIPEAVPVQQLWLTRPLLCLSALAVTSYALPKRQATLVRLLNEAVSTRLCNGDLTSLDALQALLIQVAWSQYQPQSDNCTHYMFLCCSIVYKLQLYQAKVAGPDVFETLPWTADETRAVCGTYFLASTASLLSTRHFVFPFSAYLVQASEEVAQSSLEPTDTMIPWLVQLQKYTEDLHSLMTDSSFDSSDRLVILLNSFTQIQATISHSIAERPLLRAQTDLIELMLCQACVKRPSFPLHKLTSPIQRHEGGLCVIWLSNAMLAALPLCSITTTADSSTLTALTSVEWAMFEYALNLATRLDVVSRHPVFRHDTQQAHITLDIANLLQSTANCIDSIGEIYADEAHFVQVLETVRSLLDWHAVHPYNDSIATGDPAAEFTMRVMSGAFGHIDSMMLSDIVASCAKEMGVGQLRLHEFQAFSSERL